MPRLLKSALSWLLIIPITTLLLLEGVLQLGAWLVVEEDRHRTLPFQTNDLRVIALGDSNTYGLYLTADQAYPAQLEKIWNASHQNPKIEIINLGFPGTNSSRILKNLPDILNTFKPDIITVMVGVNDFWMAPVDTSETQSNLSPVERWFRDHSRVYTLGYMLRKQAVNADDIEVNLKRIIGFDAKRSKEFGEAAIEKSREFTFDDIEHGIQYAGKDFSLGFNFDGKKQHKPHKALRKNLIAMKEIADDYQIDLVFIALPYNEFVYKTANKQMRLAAQQHDIPFIDLSQFAEQHCDADDCTTYFFPDWHPTAHGHLRIAQILAEQRLLIDAKPLPRP